MVNVNILNNLIKSVSEQIPLVNSFYTESPYESWNTKEVQYGSVSFVITKVNTRESTTTYDCTLYYADRLTETKDNRDSVWSDAATVIQTIVGALNQSTDFLEVSYPVGITLFEQDFADVLAGGYASLSISTEGFGECFDDEFSVPEIITTSAYYTKEEITELFPLKTQLSTVAFTGSYSDLIGVPELVNRADYEQSIETITRKTDAIQAELDSKLDESVYSENILQIEKELSNRATVQNVDTLRADLIGQMESIYGTLDQKVSSPYFEGWKETVENRLDDAPTGQEFESLTEGLRSMSEQMIKDLSEKVSTSYFEGYKKQTTNELSEKADKVGLDIVNETVKTLQNEIGNRIDRQSFDVFADSLNAEINEMSDKIANSVSSTFFNEFKRQIEISLGQKANQIAIDQLYESVELITTNLAVEIKNKVSLEAFDEFKKSVLKYVTQEQYDELLNNLNVTAEQLANAIAGKVEAAYFDSYKAQTTADIDKKADKVNLDQLAEATEIITGELAILVEQRLTKDIFYAWKSTVQGELNERVTRQAFVNFAENIYKKDEVDILLSQYETKIDSYLGSAEFKDRILAIIEPIVTEYLSIALDYYTKAEMDEMLSNISLEDYYNKEEVDSMLQNLDLSNYYTKTEIDVKLSDVEVDLSDYYRKSETYNRSEVYNKSEIDSKIGNINSILNNVLYTI